MNWEEIDQIEREAPEPTYKPENRLKVAPSVERVCGEFDKLAADDTPLTEEIFHQTDEKALQLGKCFYLQKTLDATLRWQSLCQASS